MQLRFISFVPATMWVILIAVLLLLPGQDLPTASFLDEIYFDKWVHVGLFGMLTILFAYPFLKVEKLTGKLLLLITALCIVYGILMEYAQKYFTTDRAFDISDMIADACGCIGAFLFIIWFKKRRKLNTKNI